MPHVRITTTDGTLVDQIDTSDYDLTRDAARALLILEIRDAVDRAVTLEHSQAATRVASRTIKTD